MELKSSAAQEIADPLLWVGPNITGNGAQLSGTVERLCLPSDSFVQDIPAISELPEITNAVGFENTSKANIPASASDQPIATGIPAGRNLLSIEVFPATSQGLPIAGINSFGRARLFQA